MLTGFEQFYCLPLLGTIQSVGFLQLCRNINRLPCLSQESASLCTKPAIHLGHTSLIVSQWNNHLEALMDGFSVSY